jgi:hypothetical protein
MNIAVALAMFGWIPVVLALFLFLPPRRAVLWGFLLGWIFLPFARYPIEGLPDYTKIFAICGITMLAAVLFDFRRFISLRPRLVDIPILIFCACPFVSSVINGLGVHEGLSATFDAVITWGVPYAIGRLYFDTLEDLRSLATGIATAVLAYLPLCLFELAKGPELHHLVYGYYQPFLDLEKRYGILRPMVFLDSGLMLAVWMAVGTVVWAWLWKSRAVSSRGQRWIGWLVPVVAVTTVALRSVNGWVLMTMGLGLLALHSYRASAAYLIVLTALIPIYVSLRATGLWSGEQAIPVVESIIDASKGRSILYRLRTEDVVVENMRNHAIFGWGRRTAAMQDHRGGFVVRDSLWIIAFSQFGAVGLASMIGTLLVPVVTFIRYIPASRWLEASAAPAAALAIVLLMYTLDDLANAMINPIYMLAAGGLAGLTACRQTS